MYMNQFNNEEKDAFNLWLKHTNRTTDICDSEDEYYLCESFIDQYLRECDSLNEYLDSYIERFEEKPITREKLWCVLRREGYFYIISNKETIYMFVG